MGLSTCAHSAWASFNILGEGVAASRCDRRTPSTGVVATILSGASGTRTKVPPSAIHAMYRAAQSPPVTAGVDSFDPVTPVANGVKPFNQQPTQGVFDNVLLRGRTSSP